MKDNFLIIDDFKKGWHRRLDPSRIPIGGSQRSVNITLTDRGGIAPRGGELLLGAESSEQTGITSLFSFKKTDGTAILIKAHGTVLEYYSNNAEAWSLLKDGYTSGIPFGFSPHNINVEFTDLVYFGNGIEPLSRWQGWDGVLNGALVGAETEVIVDSVLTTDIHFTGTASSVTTTTVVMPAGTWAADIWDDFYVRITSGAKEGFISKITATTATQITFDAISGLTGTPTFEIRRLVVPATGTLIYNDQTVAYTGVPRDDRFTVGSAHAASDNSPITVSPTEYKDAPRGSLLTTLYEDMYIAGDPAKGNTVFRSATGDATDYSYSATRAANEGDVAWFPYGGAKINDIIAHENGIYILKPDSIESLSYTKDSNDLASIEVIIQADSVGPLGRAWKQGNDVVYVTADRRITSIGRVANTDIRPQTQDLAYDIRREIINYNPDTSRGEQFRNRGFVGIKSDGVTSSNDRLLVYNKDSRTWEGYWHVNAGALAVHNNKLYYGDSYSPNVYQLMKGINKVKSGVSYPITSEWQSGFINKRGSGFYLNEISCLAVEGYIASGTKINFKLYKDFAALPFQELSLEGTETEYQDNVPQFTLLGGEPLGLTPLGGPTIIGEADERGRRHFIAFLNFNQDHAEYFSVAVGSNGKNQDWEIIALGVNAVEDVFQAQNKNKN